MYVISIAVLFQFKRAERTESNANDLKQRLQLTNISFSK